MIRVTLRLQARLTAPPSRAVREGSRLGATGDPAGHDDEEHDHGHTEQRPPPRHMTEPGFHDGEPDRRVERGPEQGTDMTAGWKRRCGMRSTPAEKLIALWTPTVRKPIDTRGAPTRPPALGGADDR